MFFLYDAKGNLLNFVPEEVYQSSNGANTLYIIAPLSSANQVLAYFTLPNGKIVSPVYVGNSKGLTLLDTLLIDKTAYSVWNATLSDVITAMAGVVSVQFSFINGNQKIRTQSVDFIVSKGSSPYEPIDLTTKTTLEDLLGNISSFITDSNNKIAEFKSEVGTRFSDLETDLQAKVNKAIEEGVSNYDSVSNKPILNANLITLLEPQVGYYRHTGESKQNFENGCIYHYNGTIFSKLATNKYVDDRLNGANKAVSFINYSSMITSLDALDNTAYDVGQNIMIVTLEVPDLWVSEIMGQSVAYTYISDTDFINQLNTNGYVQVGYYKLSALETQKVDLSEYAKVEALNTKLDIPITDNTVRQVISFTKNGIVYTPTMIGSSGIPNAAYSLPAYYPNTQFTDVDPTNGQILITGDPKAPAHVANKKYVDEIADTKLDKVTTITQFRQAYIKNIDGSRMMINIGHYNRNGAIPQYAPATSEYVGTSDDGGTFGVTMPQQPYQAAPKKYVDEAVASVSGGKLYRRELYIAQETFDEDANCTSARQFNISSVSLSAETIVNYTDYMNNADAVRELASLVRAKYKNSLLFVGDAYQSYEHTTMLGDFSLFNTELFIGSAMGMNNWKIDITKEFTVTETITEI